MGFSAPSAPAPLPPPPPAAAPATIAQAIAPAVMAASGRKGAAAVGAGSDGTLATTPQGLGAPQTAGNSLLGGTR